MHFAAFGCPVEQLNIQNANVSLGDFLADDVQYKAIIKCQPGYAYMKNYTSSMATCSKDNTERYSWLTTQYNCESKCLYPIHTECM